MIGQTVSHYNITEKLGEGGMGVVYKAEDTQLRRTVALKFLTQQGLSEPETKARLIREAQAAAALDHPHICSVFGIHDEDGRTFIAMAFIDGASLADKIKERPVALEEACRIAIQIGEGLQEAHEQGVVHRDIKPANIMLTRKGQVKIMDFGLAYLAGRSKLTKSGTTMGTPVYMSPEQALGQTADRRSDIWSVGVVLYEMLAGKPPFESEYEQAIVYSIINETPEPLTARRTGLPVEIDRVMGKVLAKDPAERYQHVEDLGVDLKSLLGKLKSIPSPIPRGDTPAAALGARHGAADGTPPGMTDRAQHAVPLRSSMRERISWGLIAVLLGLCIWLAATTLRGPVIRPSQATAFSIVSSTAGPSAFGSPALSPDGSAIVFTAQDGMGSSKLWLRRLDSPEAQPLEGTEGAAQPFWSPDGRFVAFFASQRLKKMQLPAGPAIDICVAQAGRGGSWGTAGSIVLQPVSREPLYAVPSSGGELAPVTELSAERLENSHRWPHFLPDGRRFLYTARATPENTAIYAGSLDSKQARRLLVAQSNAAYAAPHDGVSAQLLSSREGVLLAQPFDAETLVVDGEAVPIARGLPQSRTAAFAPFAVSGDGRVLAYLRGAAPVRRLVSFDRTGQAIREYDAIGDITGLRLSPDGTRALLSLPDPDGGNRDLWVFDVPSGSLQRLTTDPANDWIAAWSPAGDRILFASDREGRGNALYTQPSSGVAQAEPLFGAPVIGAPEDWSPDGNYVAYHDQTMNLNLWVLPLKRETKPIPFGRNQARAQDVKFSPDGRWVAYTSSLSGQFEIYVHSAKDVLSGLAAQSPGRKISLGGGAVPRWRRDGKELLFLRPDETLMSVEFTAQGPSSPRPLFKTCPGGYFPEYYRARYDVAPDGQRFLFDCPAQTETEREIRVVVNWSAMLGQ